MRKITSLISAAACAAALTSAPFAASAAETDKVYGTMNIPYADFYAAEIEEAYEVDAVSSATQKKWKMNGEGEYVEGTYNDDNGTILGVRYPVEVSAADVDALTAKYQFTVLDSKPTAYKEVSVSGDKLSVSKVVDTDGEQNIDGSATVSTSSYYGDYQIKVTGYPENTVLYGVIVNTKEDDHYAMRHLENIWRSGSYAWSAGIKTVEYHGNDVRFEDYENSKGKTVTSVTFITVDGYTTVNVGEQYLPVVFAGEAKADDAASGSGKTSLSLTGFPEDYEENISVGDGFTASETEISYTDVLPGKYTVTVSDVSGKYAPITSQFTLSTDKIPVKYENGKLVKAYGASDADLANYLKNITKVTVGDNAYNTGRRGVTVIDPESGEVLLDAKSGDDNVFDGSGNYKLSVEATGYEKAYEFEINSQSASTTAVSTTTTSKTTTKTTTTAKTSNSNSPKTGVTGAAVPVAVLALAGLSAFAMRKKND